MFDRPVVWYAGSIKTPPFSVAARIEAGVLLRQLQRGDGLRMPHSRPLPGLGVRCHELRVPDAGATWRIVYRLDHDAVVVVAVFAKKTRATPATILRTCRQRLREYDAAARPLRED